ncbi:hypothetical protein PBY51_023816 [Eleginops maclovinus]|uniref:Uncharacterized protein n=1 Tax=Eleginops maclovinus TaxID=56733 RepID=A0AAN8A3Z8_ELEMC|nr:hypothetical protein PBY51_023816 [Eleginops maclovinus]
MHEEQHTSVLSGPAVRHSARGAARLLTRRGSGPAVLCVQAVAYTRGDFTTVSCRLLARWRDDLEGRGGESLGEKGWVFRRGTEEKKEAGAR